MRTLTLSISLAAIAALAPATTLERMSVDDMIRQSTAIVRAKVAGSHAAQRGATIYTYYQFEVLETLKAGPSPVSELAVPGGMANGVRQVAAGAPALNPGQEYVIFLWTSRSGMTQVIGFSQGLFTVMQNGSGESILVRPAITDLMLDRAGRVVSDQGVSMKLSDLRSEIQKVQGK
jgi:hypothetical protein